MTVRYSIEDELRAQHIFYPAHIEFRGTLKKVDGGHLDSNDLYYLSFIFRPVAKATENIILPDKERYNIDSNTVSPKTIINMSALPTASAQKGDAGKLEISLGILFAFNSLPSTVTLIQNLLKKDTYEISDIQNFKVSSDILSEIDALMNSWYKSFQSGWKELFLSLSGKKDLKPLKLKHFSDSLVFVVVGHELAHWFESIYKQAEWTRIMNETERYINTCLLEDSIFIGKKVTENIKLLLNKRNVLDNWKKEVRADTEAFDYLASSCSFGGRIQSREILRDNYVTMAYFFSLLTMFEIFFQRVGIDLDVSTHPPAATRRAIFNHIQRKKCNMSLHDYMFTQNGSGFFVSCIMEKIISEYVTQFINK
jgi:hypothetical protein